MLKDKRIIQLTCLNTEFCNRISSVDKCNSMGFPQKGVLFWTEK